MTAKTKCYDLTQEALSDVKRAVFEKHRSDGVVDAEEAYIEQLVEEACRSARVTATFVRTGIRWLGGGGINSGLLVEVRACDREMQETRRGRTKRASLGEDQAA